MASAFVSLLLLKTFVKTFARQVYLKLTKFTRRSNGPRRLYYKMAAGREFLSYMFRYNRDVIQRSRRCLGQLAAHNIKEVFLYGEREITEFIHDLTFASPVKVRIIHESCGSRPPFRRAGVSLEEVIASNEKIVIASVINTEARMMRLRALGIAEKRMVLLSQQ